MNSEVDELFVDRSLHISGGGQVLIATHSPALLNTVEPGEVFCFMRDKSCFARIVRALDIPGVAVAVEKGESMGHLLEQGVLGKRAECGCLLENGNVKPVLLSYLHVVLNAK